jgi:hypothetical protein
MQTFLWICNFIMLWIILCTVVHYGQTILYTVVQHEKRQRPLSVQDLCSPGPNL